MLEKQIYFEHSITELGDIQVRRVTKVMEDGREIGKSSHRHVVSPGDNFINEVGRTKKIAKAIHTSEVIAAYEATIERK